MLEWNGSRRCVVTEESEVITLQDEDGLEHRFNVVDIVEVDRRRYAVLLPEDEDDAAAVIFRMEGEDRLVPIEDDEELTRVMTALEQTRDYGEIILEEGDEDAEDLSALEELGGNQEANDEDEEDD
jgi:uncharacterized protein YrzB (UPF0473 family)